MVWPYFTAQAPYVFFPLQETVFTLVGALFIIYACWMLLAAPIWLISVLTNIVDGVVGIPLRFATIYFGGDKELTKTPMGSVGRGMRTFQGLTWDIRCMVCGQPARFAFLPIGIIAAVVVVKLVRLSGRALVLGTAVAGLAVTGFVFDRFDKPAAQKVARVVDGVKKALIKAL